MRALEASSARARVVRRESELDGVDGLVVPGGESTTMSKLLVSFGLFDPLAGRRGAEMRVYGAGAGVIVLASAIVDGRDDHLCLGALDMVVRRNAFGRQSDSHGEDLRVEGIAGGPLRAVFIRAPWVESVGPGVRVIARAGNREDGPIVAVRKGAVMDTSFHPEIGGDHRFHALFVNAVRGSGQCA